MKEKIKKILAEVKKNNKWELEEVPIILRHKEFLKVEYRKYRVPKIDYSIITFCPRGTVIIVALTKKEKKLIFLRQYRPAAEKEIINLPGGRIDKGDTAEIAARKELKDEVGFIAKDFKLIGKMYSNSTRITDQCTIFFVRDAVKAKKKTKKIETAEKNKKILFFKKDEVEKMIKMNKIKCMASLAAILLVKEKGLLNTNQNLDLI